MTAPIILTACDLVAARIIVVSAGDLGAACGLVATRIAAVIPRGLVAAGITTLIPRGLVAAGITTLIPRGLVAAGIATLIPRDLVTACITALSPCGLVTAGIAALPHRGLVAACWRHGCCLGCRYYIRIAPAIRHEVIARHVRSVRCELVRRRADFPGIMRLQTLDQRGRRRARRAIRPKFVPEARRPQAALRLIEGIRIVRVGLYLLDQSGNVTVEAIILDRNRHLPKMVAVLDPLSNKGCLVCIVMERCRGGVQVWQRRRIEQRLNTRVALSDIDNVPMDIVDRTPNKLSEICSQYQRARWRVRVLDGCDLFIELIDDDVRVQIGEVIDCGICSPQHLLHADKI